MLDTRPLVLVVEDEDGIRALICTLLRLSGFEVLNCAGAEEALELFKIHGTGIHLVLTDVNLGPLQSGPELAQDLRILYPSIRILYISGREEEGVVAREVVEGSASFLAKPFTPKSLTQAVSRLMLESAAMAPLEEPTLAGGLWC
jgi:two-component system, cell cycle sensor histidine kinase and response regulator CckA